MYSLRRRLLAPMTLLALVIAIVWSPGGSAASDRAGSGNAAPSGHRVSHAPTGTVLFSDYQFPDTLNPVQAKLPISQQIIAMMWDPLIGFDDESVAFGDLVRTVPTVQNGGAVVKKGHLYVTLTLRPNLKWTDGAAITSADILFGWQVYMEKATGPACSGTCNAILAITTPDPSTAVIEFHGTPGSFLLDLPPALPVHAFASAGDAAEQLGQQVGYNYEASSYVTSGPFQVSQVVPNDHITMAANPNYNANVGPYLSTITFVFYATKARMLADATSNLTDVTSNYSLADIANLVTRLPAFNLVLYPGFHFEQALYNVDPTYNGAPNPLSDVNVRKALNMAVDRNAVCQSVFSLDPVTCSKLLLEGVITPSSALSVSPTGLGYDVAAAQRLIAASAFPHGFTLDMIALSGSPVRQTEATAIQADWSQLGVTVSLRYVSSAQLRASWNNGGVLAHGQFQVAIFPQTDDYYPDWLTQAYGSKYIDRAQTTHSTHNQNFGGVIDPQLDTDLTQEASNPDQIARTRLFADADQRIIDQAYMLGLYSLPDIYTVDPNVGYFLPNPAGDTWNSFEWYSPFAYAQPPPAFNTRTSLETPTPTSTSTATSTAVTSTSTRTPTPSATNTPTVTPTPTRTPTPTVSIVRVEILHSANHQVLRSNQLKLGDRATFVVEYAVESAGANQVAAAFSITRNGKSIGTFHLHKATHDHHPSFAVKVKFGDPHATGTFFAHFHLTLGPATAKRDRKFTVSR
jgi:peptide/nickel transport system substrate-binding protein